MPAATDSAIRDLRDLLEDLDSADSMRRYRSLVGAAGVEGVEAPNLNELLLMGIHSLAQMVDLLAAARTRVPAGALTSPAPRPVAFVDLGAQHRQLAAEIQEAVSRVLGDGDFILGHEVELFEREFAAFCHVDYGVGVDSGTSALELALRACGVGPGDEVITVANSFIATAFAISSLGARPVLVDIDPGTYTIDVDQAEAAVTARTRAIVPVHLYGQPADMDPLLDLAQRAGLVVVEDACQAHGALYRGRRIGSFGTAAAFSFYPAKNLGACGDGGMVVTGDPAVADIVRSLRNYGQCEKYRHELRGYNRRLDTLQAAILRRKLPYLEAWNAARRRSARLYGELLVGCPVALPRDETCAQSVYHLYVVRTEDRDALAAHLAARGVATGIHYPVPIHLQPAYRELGHGPGDFPVSESYARQVLSLPMHPHLDAGQVQCVAEGVETFFARAGA